MPFLIFGVLILCVVGVSAKVSQGGDRVKKRIFGLDDVEPDSQGGAFTRDYDTFFEASADKWNVPFALLKAHAIKESSLNPDAFMDENPKGDASRKGWASRGLMQVLWWPGSERLSRYGYRDKDIGLEGGSLFDPQINIDIAAQIIRSNLQACGGNLRDAINMYNTGKKESEFKAPYSYVDKVLKNYNILLRGEK